MLNKIAHKCDLCVGIIFSFNLIFISVELMAAPFHKDNTVTKKLFLHTKVQCVGRYLIDVPQSFENQIHDMIFIDDFKIESKPLHLPAFEQRVERRKRELEESISKPENRLDNAPFIKEIITLPDNRGFIFDHNRNGSDDSFREIEAHVYVDKIAFIITSEIFYLSSMKYSKERESYLKAGFSLKQTNDKPIKIAELRSLISRLSGRKDENIPIEKGVCIPNGFIRDNETHHQERITFRYYTNDFTFGLETDNTEKGSGNTLFIRSSEVEQELTLSGYKRSISRKEFSPGGIPVQQWLVGGKRSVNREMEARGEKVSIYDFILYANEARASLRHPWLSIGLNSEYNDTQYSESEMIAIWDRLVGSLRYRPGAF